MSISLKDDILNAVQESKFIKHKDKTPKFRDPAFLHNPNLGWQPTNPTSTKPPTSGSNAVKPNPKYVPTASKKKECTYSTPCGWCTKWDKECDKKIPKRGLRVKENLIEDALGDTEQEYVKEVPTNQICKSEEDHEWECCGMSTAGTSYRCKKCYAYKDVPFETKPIETYLTSSSVIDEVITNAIKEKQQNEQSRN